MLADALRATGWVIEGARRRGVDVVMAQQGRRITDFTRGQRLGKHDHVLHWPRPPNPQTMSTEDYARYPAFIVMRKIKVKASALDDSERNGDPKIFHCSPCRVMLRVSTS